MTKNNTDFFREKSNWANIKDNLLCGYLTPYIQKILTTNRSICYVDCFAGKGKFEDNQAGSPLMALQIRDECLSKTKIKINKAKAINMTFIDLNYASDLAINLAPYDNHYGKPNIISGKFEDNIISILKSKKGQNVFLYIDPYGIRALDTSLFDQFQTMGFNTFEMLINFNSFGFFRNGCRAMGVDYKNDIALQGLDDLIEYDPLLVTHSDKSTEILTKIAGGDYWKKIVMDYKARKINGYIAEQQLSAGYKERLKKSYKYVLDMPIRLKPGSRPKYRMVHVCDHEDGCFLMARNMQNRKDELYTNIQSEGQFSLFDMMDNYSRTVEGEYITISEIKDKVKETIKKNDHELGITKLIASFVNSNGLICEFKTIQDILSEFESDGIIKIIRNPATTSTGKKSCFWEEKNGKTVTIRRLIE